MKKIYLLLVLFLALSSHLFSQALTGTRTINPVGGNYTTITAAVNALNLNGVGTGGVTFLVAAGTTYNEAGISVTTVTSSASNPVTFVKDGAGANPVILGKAVAGTTSDAIFSIRGSDYITLNGIDIVSDPTATLDADKIEYGLVVANSGNNGPDRITIKNLTINIEPRTDVQEQFSFLVNQGASSISGIVSNLLIDNVTFLKGRTAIYLYTQSLPNENIEIKGCRFGEAGTATQPLEYGSVVKSVLCKNLSFHDNEIQNIASTSFIALFNDNFRGVNNIYNNKIHNLRSTSTAEVSGLTVFYQNSTDVTAELNLYNNVVYDFDGARATSSAGSTYYRNLLGIYATGTAKHRILYNTITGSSVNPNENILLCLAATNSEIRNNIFADYSTPGTYTYRSLISSDGVIENNNFWIDESLTNNYTYSGTNFYKFKSWQKWTTKPSPGYYLRNLLLDPDFTDRAAFNFLPKNPSPASNNGQPLALVTTGINGTARSATTPDIGAYEGDFGTSSDLYPPIIKFQPLISVAAGEVRLTADISDNIGVSNAILWYRVKGSTVAFSQVAGSQFGNIWEFLFPALASGTYEYFVCAKDVAGNVVSNGFMTSGLSVNNTGLEVNNPPANPDYVYSFSFGQTLAGGTYTVGAGGNYTSLTNTGGLFDAINSSLISGNIAASITSDLVESGTITLKQWQETGAGNYTLLIEPSAATLRTISNSNPTPITIEGADRIIIDGTVGSDNINYLKFTAANAYPIKFSSIETNGCNDITIRYCDFSSVSWACINSTGVNHSNFLIENVYSNKGYSGVVLTGVTAPVIRNSVFGSTDVANSLMSMGIMIDKCSDILVENNKIQNVINPMDYFNTIGIRISNTTGGTVTGNLVTDVKNNSLLGSNVSNGLLALSSKNLTISNNIFTGITGNGSPIANYTEGIKGVAFATCDNIKFYYNTVNLYGTGNGTVNAVCFSLSTESSINLNISNNILSNTLDNTLATFTNGVIQNTIELSNVFRNNMHYVGGTKAGAPFTIVSVGALTLAQWQSNGFTPGNGRDLGSGLGDPKFTSGATNDVSLLAASPAINSGLPLPAVTTDFYGNPRNANTPDIGAVEDAVLAITTDIIAPVIEYVPFVNSANTAPVFAATITDNTGVFLAKFWYRAKGSAVAFTGVTGVKRVDNVTFDFSLTGLTPNAEYEYFICAADPANVIANGITDLPLNAASAGLVNNSPAASPLFVRSFKVTDLSITVGTIAGTPVYVSNTATATVNIPYTVTGTFSANSFDAYLSDASGNFGSETKIGTLISVTDGTITGTIPVALTGTGYKIRVKSTSPSIIISNPTPAFQIINDNTSPAVTISSSSGNPIYAPFTATIEFNEEVTGFAVGKITATNAALSAFIADPDNKKFTVTVTPGNSGNVTIKIAAGQAADLAGNSNGESNTLSLSYIETGVPHLNITSAGNVTYFNSSTITATFTFDQDVSGFELGDITVTNGTASNFLTFGVRVYSATITPSGQGPLTISVADDAAINATSKGNSSSSLNLIYDSQKPGVTISRVSGTGPVNLAFDVYVDFTEEITGMTLAKLSVTNGTASNLIQESITRYRATILLTGTDGTVTLGVSAGAVTDAATNTNTAATDLNVVVDRAAPAVVVSRTSGTGPVSGAFNVTFTFNEDVTGFDIIDITVVNGTAGTFTTSSAKVYTAEITPSADGTVDVSVSAAKAADLAGNTNTVSNTLGITADLIVPTIVVTRTSGTGTVIAKFNATFTFSEDVTGFSATDVTVVNGTAGAVTPVSSSVYTADITPTGTGNVTVSVAAATANDLAGNPNTVSNSLVVTADLTLPGIVVTRTSGTGNVNGKFNATFTFTEDVTGFDITDFTLVNGTASAFVTASASVYTADITPTTDGVVSVSVAAAKASDLAGNSNTASNTVTITADLTAPTVVISRTSGSGSVSGPFNITVTFSEDVTNFDLPDVTITNGTGSNPAMVDNRTYTADITPTAAGDVTIDVAAGVATDLAGNPNTAAVPLVIVNIPTGDVTVDGDVINVYPNPSAGVFKVQISDVNAQTMKIYDLSGKPVYSDIVRDNVTEVDLQSLPKGIYMLHILEGKKVTIRKIIIK